MGTTLGKDARQPGDDDVITISEYLKQMSDDDTITTSAPGSEGTVAEEPPAKQTTTVEGVLQALSRRAIQRHPDTDTAALAPEETDRVPMAQRGVSRAFLRHIVEEMKALGRADYDCGQWLNGGHTTDSKTDWKEFSRIEDPLCGKACTMHTGTSFAETCIDAGLVADAEGRPFFGRMNTFISYTWRSAPNGPKTITLANLVAAAETELGEDDFCFVDVFVCAQHRGQRPASGTCPNSTDVDRFQEVIEDCQKLLLYTTPLTSPLVLTRVWCLYEIMSAMRHDVPVRVVLAPADRDQLEDVLASQFAVLEQMFTKIKSEQAQATVPKDREMVFSWIREALGTDCFREIDTLVAQAMRGWLASEGLQLVHNSTELLYPVARLLKHLGRLDEAEPLYRRALEVNETTLGSDHSSTALSMLNLASLLQDQGKLAGAEPLMRRALEISEAALTDPERWSPPPLWGRQSRKPAFEARNDNNLALGLTQVSMNNLASLLQAQGKLAEAEPLMRRALEINEAALGPEHSESVASINTLALLLQDQGKLAEAEPLMRRVLEITEAAHGSDHFNTGVSMNNLANLLQAQGKLAEAEPLMRRALEIQEVALGSEHSKTGTSMNNLASLLQAQGKLAEAEPLYRRALEIQEVAVGSDHSSTAVSMNNLASLLRSQGKLAEAEPLYRRVLVIREAALGLEHSKTGTSMITLARLLRDQGKLAEAEPLMRWALEINEAALGSDHSRTVSIAKEIADCQALQERAQVRLLVGDEQVSKTDAPWSALADPSMAPLQLVRVEPLSADTNIANAQELVGRAALVTRGGCSYFDKARRAAECGAAAVIVVNNDEAHPDATVMMGGPDGDERVTAPVVMVSQVNGAKLLSSASDESLLIRFAAAAS